MVVVGCFDLIVVFFWCVDVVWCGCVEVGIGMVGVGCVVVW